MVIDSSKKTITLEDGTSVAIDSPEGFRLLSHLWTMAGISQKYSYGFSWLGRPIIQMPDDMIRIQEVITQVKPNLIIETGVAHGGSLVYYASLLRLLHRGCGALVIGVDREIREVNRIAIAEARALYRLPLHTIEGDSVAASTIEKVDEIIDPDAWVIPPKCLVVLDSNHSYQHVLAEMRAYAKYVSIGSYMVVSDGIIEEWSEDNPARAARDYVAENSDRWKIVEPEWPFNEGHVRNRVTGWPGCFVQRVGK